jgi:hypothetical protein
MVRATDNGYPSMYAEAIISIVVTNASGTTSVPVSKQYFNTSIFHPEGSPIGRISPRHSSKEINVTYIPMEDYTLEGFSLNSSNGEITIANTNILSPGKFECKIGVLDNEELELMEVVDITISVTEKITTTETKEENNMQNISIDSELYIRIHRLMESFTSDSADNQYLPLRLRFLTYRAVLFSTQFSSSRTK